MWYHHQWSNFLIHFHSLHLRINQFRKVIIFLSHKHTFFTVNFWLSKEMWNNSLNLNNNGIRLNNLKDKNRRMFVEHQKIYHFKIKYFLLLLIFRKTSFRPHKQITLKKVWIEESWPFTKKKTLAENKAVFAVLLMTIIFKVFGAIQFPTEKPLLLFFFRYYTFAK